MDRRGRARACMRQTAGLPEALQRDELRTTAAEHSQRISLVSTVLRSPDSRI